MRNTITLEVVTNQKGVPTLRLARDIDKLGQAHRNSAKAAKESATAQAEHDYKLSQGIRGTAAAGRSMSKLTQTIGSGPNGLVGAYATLAANAFAVSASFEALRSGAQVAQIMNGLELQGARTGRVLTLVSQNIESITQGALSGAEAMKAAALGTSAGLSSKDLSELTKVATNASLVLGRNIPDSMDRIIKGVTKLEPELLDELGLMTKLTEASENYARANGKSAASLTNIEKRLAFVEAIKAEGTLKYDGVAEELGTNNLDKLAAAFSNLLNTMTGGIATSKTVSAVISTMTDSTYGLLGALTLLGAYVARQYTNHLRNMAGESLKVAAAYGQKVKALKDYRESMIGTTKATLDQAKADALAARSLVTKSTNVKGKAVETAAFTSTATAAQQLAYIKQREESTARLTKQIEKSNKIKADGDNADKKLTEKQIAKKEQAIAANNLMIESLKAQMKAQDAYNSSLRLTATNELRTQAAMQGKLAQGRAGLAMEAAAAFKLEQAYRNVTASTRNFANQTKINRDLQLSAAAASGRFSSTTIAGMTAVGRATDLARVSMHGLALGVRTVGVAFATALPWIGVITIAFSMAQAAYNNFFKTSDTKAKEKAIDVLNTVLDTLVNSTKEYNKIQDSTNLSMGDKALKAITIQTNAMVELTEAYLAYSEVVGKATKATDNFTTEERLDRLNPLLQAWKLFDSSVKFMAPSIDKESFKKEFSLTTDIAAEAGMKMVNSFDQVTDLFGGNALSDVEEQLVKTIDIIAKYDPELAKTIDTSKGAEQSQKNIARALATVQPFWEQSQRAVANFAEAIKTAETAQADFIRSIVPTTKFDNTIAGFTALNKSFDDLSASMSSGRFNDTTFKELLTNLGPSIVETLDVEDQLNLEAVKSQYSEIQRINTELYSLERQRKGNTKEFKDLTAQRAVLETSIAGALAQSEPSIIAATKAYRQRLVDAQILSITAQGDLAIAQAYLGVLQKRGVVTAADAANQMKAQNSIIALQQKQLQVEKQFLDINIRKQEDKLREIESNLELLRVIQRLSKEEQDRELTAKISAKRAEQQAAQQANDFKKANLLSSEILTLERARTNIDAETLRQQEEAEAVEDNIRRAKAGSVALAKQIKALGMGAFSAAEQTAAAARRQLEIDTQRANILREESAINDSRLLANIEIASALGMVNKELDLELLKIAQSSEQRKRALDDEHAQRQAALEIELKLAKAQNLPERVKYYERELALENSRYDTQADGLELDRIKSTVLATAIKNKEEEIQLQKEALSYQQKTLDTARELSDINLEYSAILMDLEDKRAGIEGSQASNTLKAIKAAEEAKRLSEEEFEIKKSLIILEFALLKAQRALLIEQLTARRDKLVEESEVIKSRKIAANDNALGPEGEIVVTGGRSITTIDRNVTVLNDVLSELNKSESFTDRALSMALEALGKKADATAAAADLAKEPGLRTEGGFVSRVAEMGRTAEVGEAQGLSKASIASDMLNVQLEGIKESLAQLGPEGELILAVAQSAINIEKSFTDAFKIIGEQGLGSAQGIAAGLQAVSAMISAVQSILNASSNAKIANIDKEIAAEERRDGKSAASVAKLDALEKKKDNMARKAFNTNKKLMMAQAVMSTAAGIAGALGSNPGITGIILAGIIGAMGAAQIAVIAGTQYESSYSPKAASMPSSLSIGKRGDTVDLAKGPNMNAGGEVGYLRGAQGTGTNATNYNTVGSAYGGDLLRGYGNRGFVVGEKGPERIDMDTPITVTPANDTQAMAPVNATINIQALDSSDVQRVLVEQKGNIIQMLRQAANASGQRFLEQVDVNTYTRPSVGKL